MRFSAVVMFADVAPFSATGCRSDSQSRRCEQMMEQQQILQPRRREMDFSAWEKWICRPFLTDLCAGESGKKTSDKQVRDGRSGEVFTDLAFDSHFLLGGEATRQSMTLAGFTPW